MAGSLAHEGDAQRFIRLVNALDHSIVWEFDDTTNTYTFVSDHSQLVLGYDADEWLADPHRFEKCILPDDLEAFEAVLAKLRGGEANDLRLEHRCVTADGKVLWVHTGVHRADEGGRRLLRGVTVDVNGLKAAEAREREAKERAEAVARNLEEVLAIVSHEVRNPLNALLMGVAMMQKTGGATPHVIASIARSAQRLEHLMDDLIDISNIRARRLAVDPTDGEAGALARDAVAGVADAAREKGVQVEVLSAAPLVFRCDPKRVTQVLANILSNAVKFTPAGGRVTIDIGADAHEVSFSVRDTGSGIAAEDLPHVFEREWQARETAPLGRGLGLFIAKGIVDAHAGRIEAYSEPGRGSTFLVAFPRAAG